VQPLGELSKTQTKIIELSADYMGRFFGLPVRIEPALPESVVPAGARRVHPSWGVAQMRSTFILDRVLWPRLPKDAAAYIAFTATDLWPGPGWNFVFGQASLSHRVGVWSMHRNGDPDADEASYRRVLRRTLKTAVHETAHMFSLQHCTAYECVMCGSNSLEESDRRPLYLCPECLAKLSWGLKLAPVERYRALAAFAQTHGLEPERRFFDRSIRALGASP